MKLFNQNTSDDRAVSPVIGVILMVAITVILAAVIGTFVLGLGDQLGDTAPQASFSTSLEGGDASSGLDFDIEKTGGDDIDPADLRVTVGGTETNETVATALGEDVWQTGDIASWTAEPDGGSTLTADERVTIRIVHTPSGNSVYSTTVTVPA
ncbi:type IV pilin [Halorubrum pallidum]|uniref:Type IV pilin n=1 Tax=Halorubrum pallidum TaxID=1526114 RepID=A0ABD5T2W0_9EURY